MFLIKETSEWSDYVVLSEETLTDFVRKSFLHCDFIELDDNEKQINIERLSEVRRTNQSLMSISNSDCRSLLQLIEHPSQFDWIFRQLYQKFGGDFCWTSDIWSVVQEKYSEIGGVQDYSIKKPLDVMIEIKIYSVAFSDSARDEVSLDISFHPSAPKKALVEAIRGELGKFYKEKQDEMEQLLAVPGGYNGLDETQKDWIKSWLGIKVFQECAQPEIVEDYFSEDDEGWIHLNRRAHIKVKCPLNISDYPFDSNNLYFFLISNHGRDTNEIALQPELDIENYWKGFGIGSWANPRGFNINRLLLSEATQTPMRSLVLDEGPSMFNMGVLQFGFAVTREPGSVILRTILPGMLIIFTGLVTGLWAWIDSSHSESVATQVMPGVLIAVIALQITAAQSIPHNSASTRVDKFFLFTYIFVLFMILAVIVPEWIGILFLAISLVSIAGGIIIMFKDNWHTAFNSLTLKLPPKLCSLCTKLARFIGMN